MALPGSPTLAVAATAHQSNELTASTLSSLGLSTSLQITAYQLAAGVLTQEFRREGTDAVEAGAVIVLNRMIYDLSTDNTLNKWGRRSCVRD